MSEQRTEFNLYLMNALQNLHPNQVEMIDEAIGRVGEFGEVRLVIEKGRLRYVCIQQSHDALKWVPGQLDK